jgi:hypothetical protein
LKRRLEVHISTEMASVLATSTMPQGSVDAVHWWRYKNLRTLNLLMAFPLLSLFTQG